MHTGHFILVKADSHEDAIGNVRSILDENSTQIAPWSDWHSVADDGFGSVRYSFRDDFEEWDGMSGYAVSLASEADLFHKALNRYYSFRESEFERLANQISDNTLSLYKLDQNDMESWDLLKFAELCETIYNSKSAVYDLENYTADLKYFRESEANGETDWYGVLVDFHF